MKREKEAGLTYIQKADIRAARSVDELKKETAAKCGKARSLLYWNNMPANAEDREFFDYKNKEADLARIYTGGFDADIIRRAANWIAENKFVFGREILEVGCDIGLMTGFLALEFPGSHITAIDHSPNAIKVAEEYIRELGVSNVEFICTELGDLDKDKVYDTVVSMRVLYENLAGSKERLDYRLLKYRLTNYYMPECEQYLYQIEPHLKHDGFLVNLTQGELSPQFAGWMMNLAAAGVLIDHDSYEAVKCKNPTGEMLLQCFTAQYQGYPKALEKLPDELYKRISVNVSDAYNKWCEWLKPDLNKASYAGLMAEMILSNSCVELIKGVGIYDGDGRMTGKFAAYRSSDPTAVLLYMGNAGGITLENRDIGDLELAEEEMNRMISLERPDLEYFVKQTRGAVKWISLDPKSGAEVPAD